MNRLHFAGLLTLVLTIGGCLGSTTGPLNVPLNYRPTDVQKIGLSDVNASVFVAPVIDQRDNKNAIGKNLEEADKPIDVLTTDDPAAFVQKVVADALRNAGVNIVEKQAEADRVLTLTLTRFWSQESPSYRTEVRSTAVMTDKSGSQLWKGVVVGENSKFGRSLSAENYQESLSDATLGMTGRLLATDGFVKSIRK